MAIEVSVSEQLGVDRCLRKFKRLCDAYGVVKEYRKRQEYRRPSVRKLQKSLAAEKRRRKGLFRATSHSLRHRI